MRLWDTPRIHRSLPTYTPLLNIYRPTRAYYGIYSSLREYTPSPFYNVIRTESPPLSCLDKCACSRRHIYRAYRAYISSLGTQCVQCIRSVTVPPTRGCSILDVTNLCADLGLEVGLVDLLCPSNKIWHVWSIFIISLMKLRIYRVIFTIQITRSQRLLFIFVYR